MSYYGVMRSPEYLEHYGILGMKWGVRRFQNPDGSLTEEGRKRYGDILTKDQMKNMVKSYNLRTGSKQKITKKTLFKTADGTYDHKGRRVDTETNVDNPTEKENKKTDSRPKKMSEMTDQELKDANSRMKDELSYIDNYNKLHPVKETTAKRFVKNMRNQLADEIPKGIAQGAASLIRDYISNLNKDDDEHDRRTSIRDKDGNLKDPRKMGDKELSNFTTRLSNEEKARKAINSYNRKDPSYSLKTDMDKLNPDQMKDYSNFINNYSKTMNTRNSILKNINNSKNVKVANIPEEYVDYDKLIKNLKFKF